MYAPTKLLCWVAALLYPYTGIFAQLANDSHTGLIWRGFEHNWTYNHRINRMGNYVVFNNGMPQSVYASASGLGADSTRFVSHYSLVHSPYLLFQEGAIQIELRGKEKQLITKVIPISIPAIQGMESAEDYVTLLNGFDLQSLDRADKIELLRIEIEDAEYAPAVNELHFNIKIALVANCQSLECSRFNQKTNYDLKLHYLVIAGKNEHLHSNTRTLTKTYRWDRRAEPNHIPDRYNIAGSRGSDFQQATIGIKSLALALNNAHWTIEYHSSITPLAYDNKTGRVDFLADLFFKEWVDGMKKYSVMPKHSKFSSKRKGWCMQDMGIVLLQFKDATIVHQKHEGSLYWQGKNAQPTSSEALHCKDLFMENPPALQMRHIVPKR